MADVRFSNNTNLGLNGFTLWPYNGNEILVFDQGTSKWVIAHVPNGGVGGVVNACCINGVQGQDMPYYQVHIAYLKKSTAGLLYIDWLNWVGWVISSEGIPVDAPTQQGHLVGMAIRVHNYEIQGQYNSEYLISYYNRGRCSFFSQPAGSVNAGAGWQPVGEPVEVLVWADDFPHVSAQLNMTGSKRDASLQGAVSVNGVRTGFTAATNASPGNPYSGPIAVPTPPLSPGFYKYQVELQASAGDVTLGAALNSVLNVYGSF